MVEKRQTTFLLITAVMLSSVTFGLNVLHEEPDKLIRHGMLVFGDQNKRISNETEDAAAGTEGYQADPSEASVGYQLAERKLRRLRPSVQCDEDSMTLRMMGRRVPRFLVERGKESPVPVSEMPEHCGFLVKKASRDAFLVSKYDACHMTQQGDSYILPLRVWGAQVKMSCPVAAPPFTILCTPSAMVIHLGASLDAVKLKVNGVWQPLLQASDTCGFTLEADATGWILTALYTNFCWQIEGTERRLSVQYLYGDLTLSCPLFQAPGNTTSPVHFPYLYDHPMPGFWLLHHKSPTVAPKTAGPKASSDEMWYPLPYDDSKPWSWYPGHLSVSPKTTDSTTTVLTPEAGSDEMWYPLLYENSRPWSLYHGQLPVSPKSTTVAPEDTDPATTTSTPKADSDEMSYPLPYDYTKPWPLYHGYFPAPIRGPTTALETSDPTTTVSGTTVSTPKASFDQMLYPFPYGHARPWPLYHGYVMAAPKTDPTTTSTKAVADQPVWYPYDYGRLWHFYHACLPAISQTVAPKTGQTMFLVKPPSADQQLWHPFPWVPVVTDPLNPMHSQSLPVFRSPSGVRQMNQKPWMSYFHRRSRRRLDQLCSYPAKAYNPPQQSSSDVWSYPFMANPVDDQAFVNQRWEPVTQPTQLSPVQVTAGTTNGESAFVSAQNDQTT